MKSDIPSLVAVATLRFDLDSNSASPVTLRVKADRRQSLAVFPEALERQKFYDPPERGFEREIRKRLEYWAKLRKERGGA